MKIEGWMPKFISRAELTCFCSELRRDLYPEFGFPLDVELIVERKLNLHIIPVAAIRAMIGIDAFLRSDFSGIVVDYEEFREDRYQNRLRFSIAHEAGS